MLANSNLSIIPSKPSANVSNTGAGIPATSTESFDAAFQQANDSLSGKSNSSLTANGNANLVSDDAIDGSPSVLDDASNDSPIVLDGAKEGSPVVLDGAIEGSPIVSDVDIKGVALEGSESTVSKAFDANVSVLSKSTSTHASQEDINSLTPVKAQSDQSLAGAGTIKGTAEASKLANQTGPNSLDVKATEGDSGLGQELALDGGRGLSGNSLQSDGAKVARLNLEGQSNGKAVVVPAASIGLVNEGVDGAKIDTVKDENLSETQSSVATSLVSSGLASTSVTTSNGAIEGVGDKSLALEMTAENNTNLGAKTSQSLNANQLIDQKAANNNGELDLAAGLAMIGAGGAISQNNKSMSAKGLAVGATQSAPIATELTASTATVVEESADLDWIMQQMSNDSKTTNETVLLTDTAKPQVPLGSAQVFGQNADQSIMPLAPLSLGVATAESGLINSDGADVLSDLNGGVAANTKLDAELLKQVETGSSVKAGLGDSSVASSVLNPTAQSAASDIKLGLAVNANNNQNNMTMQVPPTHPNWSSEMGEKMMWMNKQGIQQAEIHLDPPELGSLTVKVTIDSDVASVSFVAASTQVKDLLEGQVQRLREMMAQQGVELAEVDVNVSQQGSGSSQSEADSDNQLARNEQEGDEFDTEIKQQEATVSKSKVDFYA